MILVCAMAGDSDDLPERLAAKIARLRILQGRSGPDERFESWIPAAPPW